MRGRRRKDAEAADVDLTPMLDVVFILLIFFIVTATFIKEQAFDLTPPPPSDNQQTEPQPTILIRIDEDSLVYVNNRVADVGSVRASIERIRAETPESAVLVQAHPRAKNRLVVLIVDQARSAGVEQVGFAVDSAV